MQALSLIKSYRQQYPADHSLFLRFGNCRLRVDANLAEIQAGLEAYYGPFVAPPGPVDIPITIHEGPRPDIPVAYTLKPREPGKTKLKEEYADLEDGRIVRKRLTGMVFIFGGEAHLALGPCLGNLNQVVNFINNRFIQWQLCQESLLGHAAGILHNGKGLALAGFSGAGKSTLALHIMNYGATFVSNDRLMIEKNGDGLRMYGVAKLPRINPGTVLNNPRLIQIMPAEDRQRFSALSKDALWALEHKYDAPIDKCFGPDRFLLSGPMDGLIILNWKRGGGETWIRRVDPAQRTDLLPAFMKDTGLFFTPTSDCRMPRPDPETYIEYLSHCTLLECSGGIDFEKAARACLRFLETSELNPHEN